MDIVNLEFSIVIIYNIKYRFGNIYGILVLQTRYYIYNVWY